jgi:acyl transferase domain-containing protein
MSYWKRRHLGSSELLQRPAYAEAASFAAQVAFCRLLEAWDVSIDLAVCRARGDIAAAHVAGVLSLEQAATLITARARLRQTSDFRRIAAGMSLRSPRMPVISAQTGEAIAREDIAAAEFWLSAAADQNADSELPSQPETIAALFHMEHGAWGGPAMRGLATMLAQAHVRGVDVNWPATLSGSGARLVNLPTYAFQRDTFWLAPPAPARKPYRRHRA